MKQEPIPIDGLVLLIPLLLLAALAVLIAWLRRVASRQSLPGEEPDWSVPPLTESAKSSIFHTWDVRCKIATIVIYSFVLASLSNLGPALIAVGLSLGMTCLARVSMAKVLLRILALSGFLGMLLVVMPFTVPVHPTDTILILPNLDWFVFNLRGLDLAGTIAAKAVAIALLMEPLLATAPLSVTMHGLSRLGVPEMVVQMVLLSYRYVHVFGHEARRMWAGMQVRGFHNQTGVHTLRAIANFLGMLFVRSFERTERVFLAMQARGYTGRFPHSAQLRLSATDLAFSAVWAVLAITLVTLDRLLG